MVLQQKKLSIPAVLFAVFAELFHAQHGKHIARTRKRDPDAFAGKQLPGNFFTASTAGKAVYKSRMHVQYEPEWKQVVQCCFHAGALVFKAGKAGGHKVFEGCGLALLIALWIICGHHAVKLCAIHTHKTVRCDCGERCAGAFDIHLFFIFQGGIAAAGENIIRVFSIIVGKSY